MPAPEHPSTPTITLSPGRSRTRSTTASSTRSRCSDQTRTRSLPEIHDRVRTLEAILATAPEDQRGLITRLQTDGTLPFDNVADLLSEALTAQGDRQRWILEHWPHIVEYAELRAVTDTPGPDLDATLATLQAHSSPDLVAAAERAEPWLVRLVAQLTKCGDVLEPTTAKLIEDVSAHRSRWHIEHPEPLGIAAWDPDQAAERELLMYAIEGARADTPDVQPPSTEQLDLVGLQLTD